MYVSWLTRLYPFITQDVKLGDDVVMDELAAQSEGYSGADITNICRDASFMAMRRRIKGLPADEIRKLKQEEMDLPVTKEDLDDALSKVASSVSEEDIERHSTWMNTFGSA